MIINNELQTPPTQVRQLLESYVPFGSDWLIYCDSYNSSSRSYILMYRTIGSGDIHRVKAVYHTTSGYNSYYTVEDLSDITIQAVEVEYPYYAYSNIRGNGIDETLPTTNSFMCLMLVVICCLSILRTVFGGVKLWQKE